jgi:hypothetical protein
MGYTGVSNPTRYDALETWCRNHPECRGLLVECLTAYPSSMLRVESRAMVVLQASAE